MYICVYSMYTHIFLYTSDKQYKNRIFKDILYNTYKNYYLGINETNMSENYIQKLQKSLKKTTMCLWVRR